MSEAKLLAACRSALKVVSEMAGITHESRAGWAHKELQEAIDDATPTFLPAPDTKGWWWNEFVDDPIWVEAGQHGHLIVEPRKGRWTRCVKPEFPI